MQKLLLLSGSMTSGKSTQIKKLANYYDKSAYVDVDYLKWFMQKGFVDEIDVEHGRGTAEACRHRHWIAIECAKDVIARFYKEGLNIFVGDLIYTDELEAKYNELFNTLTNIEIFKIQLNASIETIYNRCIGIRDGVTMNLVKKYDEWYRSKNKVGWIEIQTDLMNVEQVFQAIVEKLEKK